MNSLNHGFDAYTSVLGLQTWVMCTTSSISAIDSWFILFTCEVKEYSLPDFKQDIICWKILRKSHKI